MDLEEDPVKGLEKRITLIESKLFQTMAQNEELVSRVESLEKVIVNKEEQINELVKYAGKQSDNVKGLELMFKNILDESENLSFSVSMLELKEKDDAEDIRSGKEAMNTMNIAFNNQNQEIDLQLLKLENEIMSGLSLAKEQCAKEAKAREGACIEKNLQNVDRIEKIEIENKKILDYLDELLATTVTLIKKTKEGSTPTKHELQKLGHNLSFESEPPEFPSPSASPACYPSFSLNPAAPPYASFVYHPWSQQE